MGILFYVSEVVPQNRGLKFLLTEMWLRQLNYVSEVVPQNRGLKLWDIRLSSEKHATSQK